MSAVVEWYNDFMATKSHPRTTNLFLMSGLFPLVAILISYIYFCISAGPRYMRNKKPYSLRKTLILYNLVQVTLSIYMLYEALMSGWLNEYNLRCQPVDYSDSPKTLRMARATHMYFLCKLTELLDTVFFVLRKKERQISFLHLFHHAVMPFAAWIGCKFVPVGHPTLIGVINTFIHVLMYSYYLLSALGPKVQKYLWWKRYLTSLQLIQFCIIFLHSGQTLFTDCAFPKVLSFLLTTGSLGFIYMFGSFYVTNYTKKTPEKIKASNRKLQ